MPVKAVEKPEGLCCPECKSEDIIGAGSDFKKNPYGEEPKRILCQKFLCKGCGIRWVSDIPKVKE